MATGELAQPTVDELINTIQRTSLPTILVEGTSDAYIYRWIERKMALPKADVLPCGGRDQLLQIYHRRTELGDARLVFVADQDLWLFDGIPNGYEEIIWTMGYSIENDLICLSGVENLLEEQEQIQFNMALESLVLWFGFEVEEYRAGRKYELKTHVKEIIGSNSMGIDPNYMQRRGFHQPSAKLITEISRDCRQYVRGKQLFQLLSHFLSNPKRGTKYNEKALHEVCVKAMNHPNIDRLIREIDKKLS